MSKQNIVIGLIAVVALAVAIIGLSYPVAQKKLGQAVSSVIGVGGPPTGVTELSFADGEIERAGKRELKMASATSTMTFVNRTGDDLLIHSPDFVIPSGSSSPVSSYVWVLATTTEFSVGTDESATPINLEAAGILGYWYTATGTNASSTSLANLKNNHTSVVDGLGAATPTNGSGYSSFEWPLVLKDREALLLRLYHIANVTRAGIVTGGCGLTSGSCRAASSTERGFDPILKFDYESVD